MNTMLVVSNVASQLPWVLSTDSTSLQGPYCIHFSELQTYSSMADKNQMLLMYYISKIHIEACFGLETKVLHVHE